VVEGLVPVAETRVEPSQGQAKAIARGVLDVEALDVDGRLFLLPMLHHQLGQHGEAIGQGRGDEQIQLSERDGRFAVAHGQVEVSETPKHRTRRGDLGRDLLATRFRPNGGPGREEEHDRGPSPCCTRDASEAEADHGRWRLA